MIYFPLEIYYEFSCSLELIEHIRTNELKNKYQQFDVRVTRLRVERVNPFGFTVLSMKF